MATRVSYRPLPLTPSLPAPRTRSATKLRQIFLKPGVITEATGSAYMELQDESGLCTKVICSVFGPRQLKKSSAFSESGKIWCDFKYAPFANKGTRQSRSGQTDQERFLSRSVEKALYDSIRFDSFPKAVLEVYILVLENDGGDFEAAVSCASAAIADAGVEMFDVVTAVSVGLQPDGQIVLDPAAGNLAQMKAIMSLALIASSLKITHCSMNGNGSEAVTKDMMELCLDGCSRLSSVVRSILTS